MGSLSGNDTSTTSTNNENDNIDSLRAALRVEISPVNDSWRLCMEQEWISLHMRLGMFPEEACAVQRLTKRSLLHEIVIMSRESARAGSGEQLVPSSIVRYVYFSCPRAMLLRDSLNGYTPLHCALAPSTTATLSSRTTDYVDEQEPSQKKESPESFDVLVCTLLELIHRSSYCDETDKDFYNNEEDDLTSTHSDISTTSSIMINDNINEEVVMLMQDHLGDTPLHTACRHGCSKRTFLALMEACPSALLIYNYNGMTPLRLLWYTLRESFTRTTSSSINSTSSSSNNTTTNDEGPHPFYTALEMIVHQNIQTYQDLSKFSFIKDAWEKTLMCLYILATTATTPEEVDERQKKNKAALNDVALIMSLPNDEEEGDASSLQQGPPELPFQILHSIASTDCDGLAMELALKFYPDEPPDEEGRSVLDVALARQALEQQIQQNNIIEEELAAAAGASSTYKTVADVLMKYNSNYSIQAATVKDLASGAAIESTTTVDGFSCGAYRKRSLLHIIEQNSSNSSYSSSLELKGVEPDEHGMLPMPSPEQVAIWRNKKIKPSPKRRHI